VPDTRGTHFGRTARDKLYREPGDPMFHDNFAVCSFDHQGEFAEFPPSEIDGTVWYVAHQAAWRCREGHVFTERRVLWDRRAR